jgi:hypothetical protein
MKEADTQYLIRGSLDVRCTECLFLRGPANHLGLPRPAPYRRLCEPGVRELRRGR